MSKKQCRWCVGDAIYEKYHDLEWGVPVYDDKTLFEFLILESFQAGLSWITILKKREHFRKAFDDFEVEKVASYSEEKIKELLQNPGIVKHKLKVRSAVTNAKAFIEIQKEYGSFSKYIWSYVDHKAIQNNVEDYSAAPSTTPLSEKISKNLKKRGFKFVGPTVIYAYMQAVGMVNDHEISCFRHQEVSTV